MYIKSLIYMSYYIAIVATNIFLFGQHLWSGGYGVRGVMVCIVAGSFSTSF